MPVTFTYVAVTSISPAGGSTLGSQAVTITGSGFSFATGVVTFGSFAATNVVIVSDTSITCLTPPHPSGDVTVTVVGVGTTTYTYQTTLIKLPPVPVLSPVGQSGGVQSLQLMMMDYQRWLMEVKRILENVPALEWSSSQIVGELDVDNIPTLPWDKVSKDGSSLADLEVPGAGSNGSFLSTQSGVPVWRTLASGSAIPRDFDPGSFTLLDGQWAAFPDYMVLAAGETITMGTGAVLRIF